MFQEGGYGHFEGLATTRDLERRQFLVILIRTGALVQVETHAGVLLRALDILLLEGLLDVVDVFLWNHGVAESRVELHQDRLERDIFTGILELHSIEWK